MLEFVQYRQRSFNADAARLYLGGLTATELQALVDDYVREEALVREARSMGLDENDFVIRQRLIQKLEFISRGMTADEAEIGDEALRKWYQANSETYVSGATATFAHVFVAAADDSEARAQSLLEDLNSDAVSFDGAIGFGDRFLYHRNYVDRSLGEIASHFGEAFAEQVRSLRPDPARWQGPFESSHGLHLVLLSDRQPEQLRPFEDVRDLVAYDARRAAAAERVRALTDEIAARYDVTVELGTAAQ